MSKRKITGFNPNPLDPHEVNQQLGKELDVAEQKGLITRVKARPKKTLCKSRTQSPSTIKSSPGNILKNMEQIGEQLAKHFKFEQDQIYFETFCNLSDHACDLFNIFPAHKKEFDDLSSADKTKILNTLEPLLISLKMIKKALKHEPKK